MPGKRRPARVLIVKPSSLGDIVHALPVAVALKRGEEPPEIDWLVHRDLAAIVEGHRAVDRAIAFDRGKWTGIGGLWRDRSNFLSLLASLRSRRYDLALDLQGLFRSGFFAALSGARVVAGFRDAREGSAFFYGRRVRQPRSLVHAVHRNLSLVETLGLVRPGPVEFALEPASEKVREVESWLPSRRTGPRVGVFPLGRWESKSWPANSAARLLDRVSERGGFGILGGSRADRPHADEVARLAERPFVDLVGRTDLAGLIALLSVVDVVVSQDSAALHLASALGRPTVGLFGPSNPRYSGPIGVPNRIVRSSPLACSPCMRRACPLGTTQCLVELPGELAALAVESLLAEVAGLTPS